MAAKKRKAEEMEAAEGEDDDEFDFATPSGRFVSVASRRKQRASAALGAPSTSVVPLNPAPGTSSGSAPIGTGARPKVTDRGDVNSSDDDDENTYISAEELFLTSSSCAFPRLARREDLHWFSFFDRLAIGPPDGTSLPSYLEQMSQGLVRVLDQVIAYLLHFSSYCFCLSSWFS